MNPRSQEYIINGLLLKRITAIMYQDCEPDVDIVDSLIAEVHARPHTPAQPSEAQQERLSNAIVEMRNTISELEPESVREKSHFAHLNNTLEEIENSAKNIIALLQAGDPK